MTAITGTAAPTQVLSSRLAATPAQVWARVCHSGFIAGYLGAQLPAADLAAGQLRLPSQTGRDGLQGTASDGRPLVVNVTARLPPSSLWLQLDCGGEVSALHLSISACPGGSRLTVMHQPVPPLRPQSADAAAGEPSAPGEFAQALARPLPVALQAAALSEPVSLQAAIAYLAETAALVAALRQAMAPHQGHGLPPGGGFSLVQHLWHLADVEQFGWAQRFERLRSDQHPVLPGVDGDRLAVERRYQQRPWRAAARRFIAQRRRTLMSLRRCDAAVLARPVLFSGQPGTGAEMLAALLAHDHEHRAEMAALWPPQSP